MNRLVLHHARKDFHAVWPWVALWLALLLVNIAGFVPAVDLAVRRDGGQRGLFLSLAVLSLARVALGMLLVVRIVQADSPAGTTAFWLTRPLPSRAVLLAKLLVIAGLIGAAAVLNVAGLLLNGLEPARVPAALADIASFEAIPLLPLAVVASLTGDTARLVLAGLACFLSYMVGRVITLNVTAHGHDVAVGVGVLLLGLVAVVCSLSCLSVQYLARQARRTLGLASVGLGLIAVVGFAAPFRPQRPEVTTPWPHGESVQASLTPYIWPRRAAMAPPVQYRRLYANLEVQGLPPGVVVRPQSVDGRFRFQDGHEERFRQELGWSAHTITGLSARDRQVNAAASHVTGAKVFHAEEQLNWYMRFPLLEIDKPEVQARLQVPWRYEGTVTMVAYRLRLAAVLPRRAGASARFASHHLTVVSGAGSSGGAKDIHVRLAEPTLAWLVAPEMEFLLVNRSRGEALGGYLNQRSARTDQLSPLYLWAPVSTLLFASLEVHGLDDRWFEGTELAVLTVEEEGAFTKRVTMDDVIVR